MKKFLFVLSLAILFAGCAKRAVIVPERRAQEPVVIKEIEQESGIGFLNVYFDFDRYDIRPDMLEAIEHNADMLNKYPRIKVRIEGHCDERGTEEYNNQLGKKRALSVREAFEQHGIIPLRIDIISYGEYRPVALDHNEDSWAENRRAETNIISGATDSKGGWLEIWDTK